MTSRSSLLYFNEKCVLIAVTTNVFNSLHISRSLPFLPEFLSRAAPIPGETGLNGPLQGLQVHICDHEYLAGLPVLDHGRDKTLLIKLEIGRYFHAVFLSQTGEKVQRSENKRAGPDAHRTGSLIYFVLQRFI
jgi:hypothetical protein